jgi:polysaccharide deacetylase 2 family uncharacterized protein YibQ
VPRVAPKAPAAIKGKIAIIIDDWGYNLHNLHALEGLKYPLTMSVLPNLNYSRALANEFHRRGFQIILHLPLEPREKYRLENNTIMTSMGEPTINSIIGQGLQSVMYAAGVSNHMGSRATENTRIMEIIFKELKKRQLYFLDSFVSAKSVCPDLARKMHLFFAKRDIFLDNNDDPEYIRSQIYKLKTRASIYGQAIGIGHDRKATLDTLKEEMAKLEKEGYKFVFLSELVR